MRCPYCGQEMKSGVIQARVAWFAEKPRNLGPRKEDVYVVRPAVWEADCPPAAYCESCKKVIISLEGDAL